MNSRTIIWYNLHGLESLRGGCDHTSWYINTKYYCNIFIVDLLHLLLFDFFLTLQNIVNFRTFRNFSRVNINKVLRITKFALPYLLIVLNTNWAALIEDSLAVLANDRITWDNFSLVLKHWEFYVKDICVNFFLVLLGVICMLWAGKLRIQVGQNF